MRMMILIELEEDYIKELKKQRTWSYRNVLIKNFVNTILRDKAKVLDVADITGPAAEGR